jgi:hypothetical protein
LVLKPMCRNPHRANKGKIRREDSNADDSSGITLAAPGRSMLAQSRTR